MNKPRKTYRWIFRTIGLFVILLLLVVLLLPRSINLENVKKKIETVVSSKLGGELIYETLEVSFFPRPHLRILGPKLSIPGKASGTAELVAIHTKLLPLLAGDVRLAKLMVKAPVVTVNLPTKNQEGAPPASANVEQMIGGLKLLTSKAPGLAILLRQGTLKLSEKDQTAFWFKDIDAQVSLPANKVEIDTRCTSSLWTSMSLSGSLDLNDLASQGQVDVEDFRPLGLSGHIPHLAELPVEEAKVNANVSFKTKGVEVIEAKVAGSIPHLKVPQKDEQLVLKANSLNGTFYSDKDRTTVSLAELNLDYPQLSLSGNFTVDRTAPQVHLKLEGKNVDADATRKVALALLGNDEDVRDIFDIVKGGHVPGITVEIIGKSADELNDLEKLVIKGTLVEGKIFAPGVDLDLEEVSGDTVISNGILEGNNLKARYGNTTGSDGKLKVGLRGGNGPFGLDIRVDADLAQLPPVLKRVVSDESFQRELALIEDVRGRATGQLVLGDTLDSIDTRVTASAFDVSASYKRLPHRAEIKGRDFSYEGSRIEAKALSGKLSKSSFSEVWTRVSWEAEPYLEIKAGPSTIFSDELYPWLSSMESLEKTFKNVESLNGTVQFSSLNLIGPIFRPGLWQLETAGTFADAAVESGLIPETLTLSRVDFSATQDELVVTFPSGTKGTWGGRDLTVEGTEVYSREGLRLNSRLSLETLFWEDIAKLFEKRESEEGVEVRDRLFDLPVHGTVTFEAQHFEYDEFEWEPFHVQITFTGDGLTAAITDTKLCGIATPGTLDVTSSGLALDFDLSATNEPLEPTLSCLAEQKKNIDGSFDLRGKVMARGKGADVAKALEGKVSFEASEGRVYHYGAIAKILNLLNVAGVVRGKLPDMEKEGFLYDSFKGQGHFEKENLVIDELILNSPSMKIVAHGTVTVGTGEMNLTVAVAPIKTADWVVEKIPIVNRVLGGTLVTIPYKVTGSFSDPHVTPLSPTALGSRILGIVKRTVLLPVDAVKGMVPKKEEDPGSTKETN